jgi:hypothetical protein
MAVAGLTYAPFGSAAYVPMALLGLGGGVIAFATLLRQRPAT